jgi:hypothetical protein
MLTVLVSWEVTSLLALKTRIRQKFLTEIGIKGKLLGITDRKWAREPEYSGRLDIYRFLNLPGELL